MKAFPKLYKKSARGKIQEWEILVEGSEIVVTHGEKLGKKQVDKKLVKRGKNKGKANETTPEQQAELQAESKWKKQLDKGYVDSEEATNDVVYLPMLAHTFSKVEDGKEKGRKKKINYPCFVQRKFDGVRCLASTKDGEVVLVSRRGKRFPHLEHLFTQVRSILGGRELILDGELYSDELTFQRLVGLVKKQTLKDEDVEDMKKVNLRVYDCIVKDEAELGFEDRYNKIKTIIESEWNNHFENISMVENYTIQSENEIQHLHDKFVREGYEGVIIRNKTGAYALNKRSNDLQKYKYFVDSEYKIVGHEEGTGRAEGTVIWVCEEPKSKSTFKVRPKGTDQERRDWFTNAEKHMGSMLTVRYQELTEDGIPRFPVGVAIRDYE